MTLNGPRASGHRAAMRTRALLAIPALLAVAAPAAGDPATLHAQLDTPRDPAALAALLGEELARTVVVVDSGAPCPEPCLRVIADGATATVTYVAPGRIWRERTVVVPVDPGDAAETIVLLAGSLVRDEADELLALDAPPAPPPLAVELPPAPPFVAPLHAPRGADLGVVYAPAPSGPRRPVGVGLIPLLSSDLHQVGRVRHALSIDLVAGVSNGADVATISGAADVELGPVRGLQAGGALAVARRIDGAQLGGALAVAGDVRGAQLAGALSIARDVRGAQLAGAVNVARDVEGLQLAGALNVARRARAQLGVVNVAADPDVVSIGVLTVVVGGRTDVEASVDTAGVGTVTLRHGGRRWHNVYGVGGQRAGGADAEMPGAALDAREDTWMLGLGAGPTWDRGDLRVDLDAMCWQVNDDAMFDDTINLLAQLRLTGAYRFGAIAAVAGVAANVYIHDDRDGGATKLARRGDLDGDPGVRIWPSLFAGVRL